MNGILKGFLQLCPRIRSWTVLSNYMVPYYTNYIYHYQLYVPLHATQKVSQVYCTSFRDHTQLEDYVSPIEKNCVSSVVKTMYKSNEILDKVAKNYTNMTVHDAIDTIFTLFKCSKYTKENLQNITQHIGFIRLLEVLNRNVRYMKINEIVISLKMLTYFKISANNIVTQSLLQMIRANLNDISLRDIIFIIAQLKKLDSTPLKEALLIALPVVFEVQLPTKLDSDNIFLLIQSLRFISENNISNPEVQNIIFKSLEKFENNLDVKTAWSIFCSLCIVSDLSPMAFELLFNIQKILISNAKQLSAPKIMMAFRRLELITTKNKEYGCKFYNEALMDAFVSSALSSAEISFEDSICILKFLNELNYVHIPFLEYLAAKCFEQPKLLKETSYFRVSIFLEGLINADYKPVFWDVIRDAILANKMLGNEMFNKSMIKVTLHLVALDCYSPYLISKIFSQQNLFSNFFEITNEPMKNIQMRELLLLYQSVKTLYPTYSGPWPPQDILEQAIRIDKTLLNPTFSTVSLKAALELALGGPQYVHNDLRTKLGHYVDHVVVMRKGGYPIAINTVTSNVTNVTFIEDIQTPNESQMILIFNLPDAAYAVNSQRLKSTWLLKIKSVEALIKTSTIAINSSSWMKLSEYERVPYLMQAIRLKCEDNSFLTN